jgi:hypothetical protein
MRLPAKAEILLGKAEAVPLLLPKNIDGSLSSCSHSESHARAATALVLHAQHSKVMGSKAAAACKPMLHARMHAGGGQEYEMERKRRKESVREMYINNCVCKPLTTKRTLHTVCKMVMATTTVAANRSWSTHWQPRSALEVSSLVQG